MCFRLLMLIARSSTGSTVEARNQRNLTISSSQGTRCSQQLKSGTYLRGTETAHSTRPPSHGSDDPFKALVVATILDTRPEDAILLLSRHYHVSEPKLSVGVLEGRTKGVAAVYSVGRREILAARREYFYNPFVIIHEFYHHLRSTSGRHRGTERQANEFAADFIRAYESGMVASR